METGEGQLQKDHKSTIWIGLTTVEEFMRAEGAIREARLEKMADQSKDEYQPVVEGLMGPGSYRIHHTKAKGKGHM